MLLFLLQSTDTVISNKHDWYSGYARFSDWRGKKCDFSTNKYVANYYGNKSEYFGRETKDFVDYLIKNKKARVGLDYYIFNFGTSLVPEKILYDYAREIQKGNVLVFEVTLLGEELHWKRIQ